MEPFVEKDVKGNVTDAVNTNWELCMLCQEIKGENLVCPSQSKRKDYGAGYKFMADILQKFNDIGQLSQSLALSRFDEGIGIEQTLIKQNARWHKSCRDFYTITKYKRAQKRKTGVEEDPSYSRDSTTSQRGQPKRSKHNVEIIGPEEAKCIWKLCYHKLFGGKGNCCNTGHRCCMLTPQK